MRFPSLAAAVAVVILSPAGVALAQSERLPAENIDASKMPESGPLVLGGNGATAGPNARNQAVSPMPGVDDTQPIVGPQLGERPPAAAAPVRPAEPRTRTR